LECLDKCPKGFKISEDKKYCKNNILLIL
jgi:hypothetical protein